MGGISKDEFQSMAHSQERKLLFALEGMGEIRIHTQKGKVYESCNITPLSVPHTPQGVPESLRVSHKSEGISRYFTHLEVYQGL